MDPTALGHLVNEHAAALELYARQWCAAPEDVVQDAFLKLMTQRRPPNNVVAWLFRVVRNQAVDVWRSAQARRKHEMLAAEKQPERLFGGDTVGLDGANIAQALQGLPSDEREVITLHLWGGLTFVEIANVIDSSASTVHRRLFEWAQSFTRKIGCAMSGPHEKLSELERLLASLPPRPAALDRDRLLFRAGQASMRRHRFWPWATAVMSAATACLALILMTQPMPVPEVRMGSRGSSHNSPP